MRRVRRPRATSCDRAGPGRAGAAPPRSTARSSSGSCASRVRMPASTWSRASAGRRPSRQITKAWPNRLSYAACAASQRRWAAPRARRGAGRGALSAASASARSRGRQVVPRLVGGGEQGVQVRVGAVGGQPLGPAAAAAAGRAGRPRPVLGGAGVEAARPGGVGRGGTGCAPVPARGPRPGRRGGRCAGSVGPRQVGRRSAAMRVEMCRSRYREAGQRAVRRMANFTRTGEFGTTVATEWGEVVGSDVQASQEVRGSGRRVSSGRCGTSRPAGGDGR